MNEAIFILPMAPSTNALYRNLSFKGRPGRVKSTEYKKFISSCDAAMIKHFKQIDQVSAWVSEGKLLHADYVFNFIHERLYTKTKTKKSEKGTVKRLDASNRIKAVEDVLSSACGIDDKYFWSGSFCKRVAEKDFIIIRITPI